MKKIVCLICIGLCCTDIQAQTTRKIQELEKQHKELQKQIAASESLLQSTSKDVNSQFSNLALLSGQIDERKKYIAVIEKDMLTIQRETGRLEVELKKLQRELKERKLKYEQSVNYMYRNKSVQEKLMFIFSAEDLGQMYRRMRYVQRYADYQKQQGVRLGHKQKQVADKQRTLENSRKVKEALLKQSMAEKEKLMAQEEERKGLLASLQKKQWDIEAEVKKQRLSANRLNAEIDRLIEIEIAQAKKREEERHRKELAAAKRKKEVAKKVLAAKAKSGNKPIEKPVYKPVEKMEHYQLGNDEHRLSGSFESNKGRLPSPITGAYALIGRYGQYQVPGLRNVRLDNKGIDLKGKKGAQARAIFDGEVSAIFQYNGMANVLVRHGSYISVYCNLSSVLIKKGSLLKARDIIGEVNTDSDGNTVLHFQLRKETVKLNPQLWLGL